MRLPPNDARNLEKSPGEEPPPGPPWDLPIAEVPFAFIDLEMTGLKIGEDRVLEVCIERVKDGVVEDRIDTIVHPGDRRGNAHIHGIDDETLAGAPTFAEIADRVVALCRGAVPVAHAASWDLAFLHDELSRLGRGEEAPTHAVDTLILCRRAFHLVGGYGLQKVAEALEISVTRAHRAGDDVATMRAIFDRVLVALSPANARDLHQVRIGDRTPRPEIVAEVEAAVASGQPVDVIYRPARRAQERLPMVLTSLVPPHAIGYLLPGRGRRELRLERILRIEAPARGS
ncbi:MAG: 3'-5' exonuclease [Polyangiales bacterium]